ncbi:MAG: beta-N-acetylhexosaminidase [Pseudolabrys sp.]
MAPRAFIAGVSGLTLTNDERTFLRDADPWAAILFKRNVSSRSQVSELTRTIREALGREAAILVDQEGGRVQRLGPPAWPAYPAGARYGALYDRQRQVGLEAAELGARLIASDLREVGIDTDCLPLADVPVTEGDPVIGDRAYGDRPDKVADIAAAVARGLMRGGVLPVLKHLPGHGRATADSHLRLPVVDTPRSELEKTDFAAFRPVAALPLGMTAHVVFSAIDPTTPATTSATMVREVIREWIGFTGLLMSDDVSMGALSGTIAERSRASIAAGCDVVLHCNGDLGEMRAVASEAPELSGNALRRADAALAARGAPDVFDIDAARARFAELMAGGSPATA